MRAAPQPRSALPLSPLRKSELRGRRNEAQFQVVVRAGAVASHLDASQLHPRVSEVEWILRAARAANAYAEALLARCSVQVVAS